MGDLTPLLVILGAAGNGGGLATREQAWPKMYFAGSSALGVAYALLLRA